MDAQEAWVKMLGTGVQHVLSDFRKTAVLSAGEGWIVEDPRVKTPQMPSPDPLHLMMVCPSQWPVMLTGLSSDSRSRV